MLPICGTLITHVATGCFPCCPVRCSAFCLSSPFHGIIFLVNSCSSPDLYKTIQPSIEFLAPDRHLHSVERVLHDVVCVQFIYLLHHRVYVRLLGLCEEEEFDTGLRLETLNTEVRAFQDFDTSCADRECLEVGSRGGRRRRADRWDWRELRCYGMHSRCWSVEYSDSGKLHITHETIQQA